MARIEACHPNPWRSKEAFASGDHVDLFFSDEKQLPSYSFLEESDYEKNACGRGAWNCLFLMSMVKIFCKM
jgi:hypothetical protein